MGAGLWRRLVVGWWVVMDVDRVVSAWCALAARADAGRPATLAFLLELVADGRSEAEVEAALWFFDVEDDVRLAGLRGRVEDLDAEVEAAHRAVHASEVAAFGEAAVTFAHAVHPDAATVLDAVDAMTPTDWVLFKLMVVRPEEARS